MSKYCLKIWERHLRRRGIFETGQDCVHCQERGEERKVFFLFHFPHQMNDRPTIELELGNGCFPPPTKRATAVRAAVRRWGKLVRRQRPLRQRALCGVELRTLPSPGSRPEGVGKRTGREKWRAGGREREREREG